MIEKELAIVGGGPGGYVAAIRAAQLGIDVALIEGNKVGGTCLNRGCIPTKSLYASAELADKLKDADEFGIQLEAFSFNLNKAMSRKEKVVEQVVKGVEKLIKDNSILYIEGYAHFINSHQLKIRTGEGTDILLNAKNIIIATGSVPSSPPIPGSDLPGVIDSDALLELTDLPKRMVVAGSGVIGMEFASIYNSFGSEITVISSTLLKRVDKDIVKRLPVILKKQGIKLYDGARAKEISKTDKGLLMTATNKKGETIQVEADIVLMAVGRRPYYDNLQIEHSGVITDNKGIKVNQFFQTNVPHIYAIGDVLGGTMLAHVASHQGVECVEYIAWGKTKEKFPVVPDCIFISPQIAYAGLTEDLAIEKGYVVKTGKFNFAANGKAVAMGETTGFVKVVVDSKNNQILGVHIMGPHASDLIHEASLAISSNMKIEAICETIHAHPTLSEAFHEASLNVLDVALHLSPSKKNRTGE
jgi:dihydrolipoamide dehydrogenase